MVLGRQDGAVAANESKSVLRIVDILVHHLRPLGIELRGSLHIYVIPDLFGLLFPDF